MLTSPAPRFASYRAPVIARRGMVASSQPLATQAGLSILMGKGNAADAAVATAAALNVTEPASTGIGGDCFALYYDAHTQVVSALNSSGRAPLDLSLDLIARQPLGPDGQLAPDHAYNVTVPGACAGWCGLLERHGSLQLDEVLGPAIQLAEDGFPVAPYTAYYWSQSVDVLAKTPGGRALTIDGRAPRAGEIFRNPGLARTLRVVAEGGRESFYRGPLAESIAQAVQAAGGVLGVDDLAEHTSTWDEPISTTYRGLRVWECPPNGQGLTALLALNVLEGFDLGKQEPLGLERWHLLVEALRLAFADTRWYIADPRMVDVPLAGLLSKDYAAKRRRLINPRRASLDTRHGTPLAHSDTVYLCAVDGQGNACSFINSNYMSFGSGIVPSDASGSLGFALHNRGSNFTLDPAHPNALAPGKRPYHTIIPGLITRADGSLYAPFGVMGGFMQPQGHVQVVVGLIDDGLDPQAALDRPRFCITPAEASGAVALEAGLSPAVVEGLAALGHTLLPGLDGFERALFGRGQIIRREPDGVLWGGSDPRADGCAMGY